VKRIRALGLVVAAIGCTTLGTSPTGSTQTGSTSGAWTDSVMAAMTLREKAAQIVWPSVYGDYVSGDSPQ
jgi:hypothetical protein